MRSARLFVAAIAAGLVSFVPAAMAQMVPNIVTVPLNSAPPPPPGLKVACLQSASSTQAATQCPVVKYLGNRIWPMSYADDRQAMALIAYDGLNRVVANVPLNGARYIWKISDDGAKQTLVFTGQSGKNVKANWAEIIPAPQVIDTPTAVAPRPPAGLKVSCMADAKGSHISSTCPVVKFAGNMTWPMSYTDNRMSLAFVTYGPRGNVVRTTEAKGTRYAWRVASNPASGQITATGQSNSSVSVGWVRFAP